MDDRLVALLALAGSCFIPLLVPLLTWGSVAAVTIFVVSRQKQGARGVTRATAVQAAGVSEQEQPLRYERLAPTRDLMLEWAQVMVVKPLGSELEAQFKALLDRALSEDLFNRFGDSFVVLMKVSCFQVVQPGIGVVQEMWNALIKRHIDFLICDRWTLEPVSAFLVWTGEGNPPECGAGPEVIESWRAEGKLRTKEWEQWIATAILISGGIPAVLMSREQIEVYLARPELLLEGLEPALAAHLERAAVREEMVA